MPKIVVGTSNHDVFVLGIPWLKIVVGTLYHDTWVIGDSGFMAFPVNMGALRGPEVLNSLEEVWGVLFGIRLGYSLG